VSRMTEAIAVLREAWTADRATFQGEHFKFHDVAVLPKPVQTPHPPIWMGALAPKSIERAGRIGDGWIAPFLQTLEGLAPEAERYRSAAEESGRPPVICLERDAAVSANREVAEEAWLSRNLALWQYYADHGASGLDDSAGDFAAGYQSQLDALELFGREVIPAFDG
jgi:alkanesulfonate monooxygenase SsuD/methylene tetrahydromethanopterin reductase-like flavin-dependent oxidoreductase (luciferase family)